MSEGNMSTGMRALWLILGIAAIALSMAILFYPGLGIGTLIILLSIGIMIGGFMLLGAGFLSTNKSGGMRALMVIIGLAAVAFSILVLVYPGLGNATLILLLAIEVMVVGIGAIVQGASGDQAGWIRALLVIVGLAIIGFGIATIVYPGLADATLVILLSISLLLIGIMGIAKGIAGE